MTDSWILAGARVARGPDEAEKLDLEISSGRIRAISRSIARRRNACCLNLEGCLILPGLINAHDHLEFNLMPRLGHGPYRSSKDWARDIYHPDKSPVKEHLSVSLATRLWWGGVKNLLSGVTTVCQHNPYYPRIFTRNFAVRIPRRYAWAHSLEFSPDLRERFRQSPRHWPFILHLGEAVNRKGKREILQLEALGALDHRTVLVHAVALGPRGLQLARKTGASIVWCFTSNTFILGKTLSERAHKSGIPIALGTDSAMSGIGDLLDEIRFAHRACRIAASRLYGMVTGDAARILRLQNGEGALIQGGVADLFVVKDSGRTPADALLKLHAGEMELVFAGGEVKLASPDRFEQLPIASRRAMHQLEINGKRRRVFIAADLPALFREAEPLLGSLRLAHKKVRLL